MACPNAANCTAETTLAIGPFIFTSDDWLDSGVLVEHAKKSKPNLNIQRAANGDLDRLTASGYSMQEVTVTVRSCSLVYQALSLAYDRGGIICYDAAVKTDLCCPANSKAWKDIVITGIDEANTSYDEESASFTFEAAVVV